MPLYVEHNPADPTSIFPGGAGAPILGREGTLVGESNQVSYTHGNQTAGRRRRRRRRTKHKTASRSRTGKRHRRRTRTRHKRKPSGRSRNKSRTRHNRKRSGSHTRRRKRVHNQSGKGGYTQLPDATGVNHDLLGTGPNAGRAPMEPLPPGCGRT